MDDNDQTFNNLDVIGYGLYQTYFLGFASEKFINDKDNEIPLFNEYLNMIQYKYKDKKGIFCNQATIIMQMFFCAMWYKEDGGRLPEGIKAILCKYKYSSHKISTFLFHFRNALAHNNFTFYNNKNYDIRFWSYKDEEKTQEEYYRISFEDFKIIAGIFCDNALTYFSKKNNLQEKSNEIQIQNTGVSTRCCK